MSNMIIIMGESGTGKSTSIRNLDPKTTFIINIVGKPLPFRGGKKLYTNVSADGMTGNYYASDNYAHIELVLKKINAKRPEIKTIIIDDFQYLMSNEYMSRALERGFDKFAEIGNHIYIIVNLLPLLRDDIDIFVLSHSEPGENGKMKLKTIGRMIDSTVTIEGRFTTILQTEIKDNGYYFITQGDARHIAKSPMGLFEERLIPNDLQFVKDKMHAYFNEEIL